MTATPPVNYTTKIGATRTVAEIQASLAKQGAVGVTVEYTDAAPTALAFTLATTHGPRHFRLPVDIDAMHRLLQKTTTGRLAIREQAERVAWRVVKDWIAAQLALVSADMASVEQVMLPYLLVTPKQTLFEAYREREAVALIGTGDES